MFTRSMMLICALGFAGCVASADDQTGAVEQHTGGGSGLFTCDNDQSIQVVSCIGTISALNNISVNVKDVRALDGNELNVLSGDLNNLKVTDINVLDGNKVLNDVQATVLNDFLNKFNIDTDVSKIDVCALVGILQICK